MNIVKALTALSAVILIAGQSAAGPDLSEFEVKREDTFEFAEKPRVTRDGDNWTIRFKTTAFCDVTVAVEDSTGRILRHLASGVLGENAPPPFEQNSLEQTLVWDGKNDQGKYVDDIGDVAVRVSLGLKPRYERSLFWSPEKRSSNDPAFRGFSGGRHAIAAAPEGVYVYDSGRGFDHVRLFDRDGNYQETVHPFPAEKIDEVQGLYHHRFPDGPELPIKPNYLQSTLLVSGTNAMPPIWNDEEGRYEGVATSIATWGMYGAAGEDLAIAAGRMALINLRLTRLATDGTSGGLPVHGPDISLHSEDRPFFRPHRTGATRSFGDFHEFHTLRPKRAALCPDGEWLYLTRYQESFSSHGISSYWQHHVHRIAFADGEKVELFLGGEEAGDGDDQFKCPADVAIDRHGRVYVADHGNNRVQVFSPDGKLVKSIPVDLPAQVSVHQKTDHVYVFCWRLPGDGARRGGGGELSRPPGGEDDYARLHKFAPVDDGAERQMSWRLQLQRTATYLDHYAEIDSWADPLTVWVSPGRYQHSDRSDDGLGNIVVLRRDGDSLEVIRDFHREAVRSVVRTRPPWHQRQRLYVNPVDGTLYVAEGDSAHGKAFKQAVHIDPETGNVREVNLPMSSEDMAFDMDGHAYLRTSEMIVRYRPDTWREVPFDYGEERTRQGYGSGSGTRGARVLSGAVFPGNKGWHQGGMHVAPNGNIVVAALYDNAPQSRDEEVHVHVETSYQPPLFPGRRWGGMRGNIVVYIFDRHGTLIQKDAVPGLHINVNGIGIDARNDIYLLNASPSVYDGRPHFNHLAGTMMKFSPNDGRLLASSGAPVPLRDAPDRPSDLRRPTAWIEGAKWTYGGVGWGGKNVNGCGCWNTRFALDYFARSFTPEIDRYNVGVLDSNGNLILRVGRYGNVDDGVPLVENGSPPNPRPIGGDEVALFHPAYVGTHTDHRLFVADAGNARIVSVKLGYHTEETIALRDVEDQAAARPTEPVAD